MKMSELILAVGDDNVQFQNLDACSITLDYSIKSGMRITFGTEQPLTRDGTERLGLVLWLPRKAVSDAIKKSKPAEADQ